MSEINPYAPVASDSLADELEPVYERIFFAGTLTEEDCRTVLLDQVPAGHPVVRWLRLAFFLFFVAVLLWLMEFPLNLLPVFWMVAAIVVSPLWMRLVASRWHRRERAQYAEDLFRNAKPCRGWCDQNGLVQWEETSAMRATWEHFDRALLFPSTISVLPRADVRSRVVLPWHFFASSEAFAAARQLFAKKLPDVGGHRPKEVQRISPKLAFDGHTRRCDVEQVLAWNAEVWPFRSTVDAQEDFTVDPGLVVNSLATRVKMLVTAAGLLLSLAFTFLLGLIGYVGIKFAITGGWQFLRDDRFFHLIVILPVLALLLIGGWNIGRRIKLVRTARAHPVHLRLREEGLFIRRSGIEAWIHRDEIISVEVDEEAAGWSLPAQLEPTRLPRSVFPDQQSFEAFGRYLQRYQRPPQGALSGEAAAAVDS